MGRLEDLASDFVGQVLLKCGTEKEEKAILLETVLVAGFSGVSSVSILEKPTSLITQGYPVHSVVFLAQSNERACVNTKASIWLDAFVKRMRDEKDDGRIPLFIYEVERSRPLLPIGLTVYADRLVEYTFGLEVGLVDHVRDSDVLGSKGNGVVGVHNGCNGHFHRAYNTHTYGVLLCEKCRLRVYFPVHFETYGELRKFLS